jgi:hypothetical protein
VRQVYYQATSRSIVPKTENGYRAVGRVLTKLRRSGRIEYGQISDNTRWQIKPNTFDSMEDALYETARLYRRSVWRDVKVGASGNGQNQPVGNA